MLYGVLNALYCCACVQGVTTNGAGILKFSLPASYFDTPKVILCIPRHNCVHPVGAVYKYVFGVLGRMGYRLRVHISMVPTGVATGGVGANADGYGTDEVIRDALSRVSGVPAVSLSAADKPSFVKVYH